MSQEMYFSRMKELLKDEYDAYMESLSKPLYRGMRINLKKAELNANHAISLLNKVKIKYVNISISFFII